MGSAAVTENGADGCRGKDRRKVIGDHISDAAVGGTGNFTAADHIPQRDVIAVEKGGFFL